MIKNVGLALLGCFFISCSTQPEPLVVGKDVCQSCKMTVADVKFGAELITEKGKLYKFDDIGCMIRFTRSGISAGEKIENLLVVNYENGKLMDVTTSFFLKSDQLNAPMNSGVAAFESTKAAESFLHYFPGEIVSWQQLQQKIN